MQGTDTEGKPGDLEAQLEQHRVELTGYCYRMLGSAFEADDAVQETMVRAWRSLDRFEGRAALRTWLYRIATNVCFDMLNGRQRRARPMDLGPAQPASAPLVMLPEVTWIEPIPEGRVMAVDRDLDPAEVTVARESVRLAFVAALAQLPPRQRAVLILREVLRWKADEAAQLLDTSVASVNSALQRARATLAASDSTESVISPMDEEHQQLLARYVDAFERFDVDTLVTLLHDDARFTMPPFDMWLLGPADIRAFYLGTGSGCEGSHLVPVGTANGSPALGHYKPSDDGERLEPWGLQIIEMSQGRIVGLHHFLDTQRMFPLFGLPLEFEG